MWDKKKLGISQVVFKRTSVILKIYTFTMWFFYLKKKKTPLLLSGRIPSSFFYDNLNTKFKNFFHPSLLWITFGTSSFFTSAECWFSTRKVIINCFSDIKLCMVMCFKKNCSLYICVRKLYSFLFEFHSNW